MAASWPAEIIGDSLSVSVFPMNHPSASKPARASKPTVAAQLAHHVGRFRWIICTVLLLGVMKNYMDRQVIGVLKTTLQHNLGWSEIDYGNLVFAFQAAYALGMVLVGALHRPRWNAPRLRAGHGVLEPRIDRSRCRRFVQQFSCCSICVGLGRVRSISRESQSGRRMVPQKKNARWPRAFLMPAATSARSPHR